MAHLKAKIRTCGFRRHLLFFWDPHECPGSPPCHLPPIVVCCDGNFWDFIRVVWLGNFNGKIGTLFHMSSQIIKLTNKILSKRQLALHFGKNSFKSGTTSDKKIIHMNRNSPHQLCYHESHGPNTKRHITSSAFPQIWTEPTPVEDAATATEVHYTNRTPLFAFPVNPHNGLPAIPSFGGLRYKDLLIERTWQQAVEVSPPCRTHL